MNYKDLFEVDDVCEVIRNRQARRSALKRWILTPCPYEKQSGKNKRRIPTMIKIVCSECGGDMTVGFLRVLGLVLDEDGVLNHDLDVDLDKLCDLAITEHENGDGDGAGDGDGDGDGDGEDPIITSDGIDYAGLSQWYARPIPSAATVKETFYLCRVGLMLILLIMIVPYFLCPRCGPALSKELQ